MILNTNRCGPNYFQIKNVGLAYTERQMRQSCSHSKRQMCTEYEQSSVVEHSQREAHAETTAEKAPAESEVFTIVQASEAAPCLCLCIVFLLARRKHL